MGVGSLATVLLVRRIALCPYPVRTRDGLACRTVTTNVCLCQCIPADGTRVFAVWEWKACSYKGFGKVASDGLKICFWETGVPVRIRPRPPPACFRPVGRGS